MNEREKLNLKQMIDEHNVKDQTELIREKKHSGLIRSDVEKISNLREKYNPQLDEDNSEFYDKCLEEAQFLFLNYMDIFNKVKKGEINIDILNKFLSVLEKIENGDADQHEASYEVGKYLKELYIDSALKKSENLDKLDKKRKEEQSKHEYVEKNISWKEFKKGL